MSGYYICSVGSAISIVAGSRAESFEQRYSDTKGLYTKQTFLAGNGFALKKTYIYICNLFLNVKKTNH